MAIYRFATNEGVKRNIVAGVAYLLFRKRRGSEILFNTSGQHFETEEHTNVEKFYMLISLRQHYLNSER